MRNYIIITLASLFIASASYNIAQKAQLKATKLELEICNNNTRLLQDSINKQNQLLKSLELDTKSYKYKLENLRKDLDSKYQTTQGATELENIKTLINTFYY